MPEDFPAEPGTTFRKGDAVDSRASELRMLSSQVPRGRNSERVRCSKVCVLFLPTLAVFVYLLK